MESFTNTLSFIAAVASAVGIAVPLWRMFRSPDKLIVTRKDTGKTVVLDTRAGWREGSKLSGLL